MSQNSNKPALYQSLYDLSIYDGLAPWHLERDNQGNFIPTRLRRPGVPVGLAAAICESVRDFLLGATVFPRFLSNDPVVRTIADRLRKTHILPIAQTAGLFATIQGSSAITFGFERGLPIFNAWKRTEATPTFDQAGQLVALVAVYNSTNENGKPIRCRITLDSTRHLVETSPQGKEEFTILRSVQHNYGFVPAVWIRHFVEAPGTADGISVLDNLEDALREHDYTASRRQRAVNYTADPTLILRDKDPEKLMLSLVKSPAGSMLLGENGEAGYLEINGSGITQIAANQADLRAAILERARVVLMNPEKIIGSAISGFALRMIYRPMINLADSLKPAWDRSLIELLTKLLLASATLRSSSLAVYLQDIDRLALSPVAPSNILVTAHNPLNKAISQWPEPAIVNHLLDVDTHWGPYFDTSPEEEQQIVATAGSAVAQRLASQETAVRMVAPITGVSDPVEELTRINATNPTDPFSNLI
jgi:hypothetical protein